MSLLSRVGRTSEKYLSPAFRRLGVYDLVKSVYIHFLHRTTPDTATITVGNHDFELYTEIPAESRKAHHGLMTEIDELAAFLNDIRSDDVVWDVGAHLGFWTCGIGSIVEEAGTVVAFEPFPPNADRLQDNITRNDLSAEVYEVALADEDGTATLSLPDAELGNTMGSLAHETSDSSIVEVATKRGDSIDAPAPTAMKIDVEGAELSVLKGMGDNLVDCRLIYLELHPDFLPDSVSVTDIQSYLAERDFDIEQLSERDVTGTRMIRAVRQT